jgi:murein DD-endopeptidase MepM/ murein hydrolase activator NlpD
VFDGIVKQIRTIEGKQIVLVQHGTFYTVYANLGQIKVQIGQNVNTNTIIGQVSADELTQQSILHFEMWLQRNAVNPLDWLVK